MSKTDVPFATTHLVRDTCLCLHVQRAARALARRFDEALRPVGLTNEQFSLMMSLNRPLPARMRDVAAHLAMDRSTLTAAIKRLNQRGLVDILVDPGDKRARFMVLTEPGRAVLASAVPLWEKSHRISEDLLDSARPDQLRRDLSALCTTSASDTSDSSK